MPYEIIWKEKQVVWRLYGECSVIDVETSNNDVYTDPRFDNIEYLLWDGTGITKVNATLEDAAVIAAQQATTYSYTNVKKAALVSQNSRIISLVNSYITTSLGHGSSWQYKVFDTVAEAEAWFAKP